MFLFSIYSILSATLLIKYLSCEIKITVPLNSFKASSNTSLVLISIWLVGSSKIMQFILEKINSKSLSLTFSPPDYLEIFLKTFSP